MSIVPKDLALSDGGFLFDPRTGTTYSLNRTGTLLLRALADGSPPERLVERLLAACRVSRQAAVRDVEQFVLRLQRLGLAEGWRS